MLQEKENGFEIGGLKVEQLVAKFGTPLYVYDGDKIKHQYHRLRNAFSSVDVRIKYACKALTNINILKLLQKEGSGCDTVSINEVKLALMAGFEAKDIMYTPNSVAFSEIEEAMKLGVQLNLDSIPFLEEFGQKYGGSVPVSLRMNPHIKAGGNAKIQVGHIGSKFGISISQKEEVLAVVEKYGIHINGVHVHTGSDILEAEVFVKGAEVVFEFARNFKNLDFLDFGGGFKVSYYHNSPTTNIEELGGKLSRKFADYCQEYGKNLQLWFEPGKFLVSESGTLLATTNIIKPTPEITFAGINSGFNHLIRPMFYNAHHDIFNVSNASGEKKTYNIVGNICETDTFAEDRELPEVRVGDVLAFKNAGAYGFEMSSNFNSRLKPAEILIENGKARVIRKRQVFEDLLQNQVLD
jgi:diaminopimelate decarboxylase